LCILYICTLVMSKPSLFTAITPRQIDLYDLNNCIFVVIDVFRATSTIATALHNGALKIIPVDNVPRAIELGKLTGGITAGERDGKVVEGLQYGNSPADYTPAFINGKILVLTTTNGTKLLHMAIQGGAQEVITGSFPNISAVCDHLVKQQKNVILGCSGWKDRFNIEDTLFAGAVISRIKNNFTIHCDSSLMAEGMYEANRHNLTAFAQQATHWHRLANYGLESDLSYCLTADVANVLPVYNNGDLVAGKA
jgi:2-phosphosulfolactate phosphatase